MGTTFLAVINHRYELVEQLGEGAQGAVFAARDRLFPQRELALKLVATRVSEALSRLEFAELSRFEHPHLAHVFDLGRVEEAEGERAIAPGTPFFTQERVFGLRADAWCAALPEGERVEAAARIGVAVARALAALHGKGLLHRDVKPSNVLVGGDAGAPAVKLIDLGLAIRVGAAGGTRAGTLGFMAPEAIAGFCDERSDLYGLGATLAAIETGRHPLAALAAPAPGDGQGAALREIVRRLTAPRPADRFDSARDVVLALGRAFGAALLGGSRGDELIDAASEADDPTTRRSRWRSAEVVGRGEEVAALDAAIRSALARGAPWPGIVFVCGPGGIGKTRLAREALVRLQLAAAARDLAAPLALAGTAAEVIAAVREETGRPAPEAGDSGREAAAAFARLRRPAVCVVEDGDGRLSGELLRHLAAAGLPADGERAPLCVIATMRGAELARLSAEATGGALVELGPLTEAAEAALIADALGAAPSDRLARAIRERTAGIPLLTETALSALAGVPGAAAGEERVLRALALPADARRLVVDGLVAAVSADARRAIAAMAALGEPATADTIAALCDLAERDAIAEAAQALARRGLAAFAGADRIGVRRSLADAVLDALAPDERKALCRRAYDALSRDPDAAPAALARCAVRAGATADAARWALRAADLAEADGDLVEAARLCGVALEHAAAGARDATAIRLAALLRQTGEYERASALLEPLADKGSPGADRARLELAAVHRLSGRPDDALRSLAAIPADAAPEIALEAKVIAARIALDRDDAEAAGRALQGVPPEADAPMIRSGALAALGLVAWHRGEPATALRIWAQGRDAARALGAVAHEARFHGLLGMAAHVERRFAEAASAYAAALALADRAGDAHGAATYAVNLAAIATEEGDVVEALVRYRDGMARLLVSGRRAEVITARANHAQLLLRLGDVAGADRASRRVEADAAAAGLPPASVGLALCVRGDVLLALGDPGAARERLLAAERALAAVGGPALAACRRHLVAAELAAGDTVAAGAALAALGDPADARGAEERLALRHLSLSAALERRAGVGPALDALVQALPGAEATPLDAGMIPLLVTAATAARELARPELARELAARGDALAERLRAVTPSLHRPEAYRGHAELRAFGRTVRDPGAGGDAPGWERLAKINTRLNSETRVGALLDLVMDNALEVTRGERGFVLLRDDPGGAIRVRSARNMDRERLAVDEQDYSRGVAERVLTTGEPIVTADALADARFRDYRSVVALDLRYIIAVPLQVAGRVHGVIYVDSRAGGQFDDGRLAILTAFADQAAIALTNARLRAENLRRQTRIEKLNRALASRLERREDELARVKRDLERRTADLEGRRAFAGIIGMAPKMQEMFRVLERIAGADVPVVVSGESGTGKELVAKAIHFAGARKLRPFVAENCAAIPGPLLESILFGHVRGAFTGANKDAPGLFVEADHGTLFLDEIGELPPELQVKLLRALQEGEVRPVGGAKTIRVDVRVVAATNQDLAKLVKEKRFRDDLYYRLHVMEIRMPPLRERREDVPILVEHFLAKHAGDRPIRVEPAALEAMCAFHWPGNVRQLENEIVRALVLCEGTLGVEHLSDAVSQASLSGVPELADLDMERQLGILQRRMVRAALDRTGGNRTQAAALLGVSRFGLQKMLARFEETE